MSQSLDDVFRNLYSAIVDAQNSIEQHYVDEVKKDYFDKDGNPYTTPVMLPTGEGGSMKRMDIPLITLVPHNGMAIKEVEVEMKVAFGDSGDEKNIKKGRIRKFITDLSKRGEGTEMAKIRVIFNGKEAPEGLARIKDSLIKLIPN